MYEYRAHVQRVVDGDTIDVLLDLGLGVHLATRLRLAGLNAPEMSTPEGKIAKAYLQSLILDHDVIVQTVKDRREKYGRYLATVNLITSTQVTPTTVNELMVGNGHAVAWDGTGARP